MQSWRERLKNPGHYGQTHGHGLFSKTMIMFHKLHEHLPQNPSNITCMKRVSNHNWSDTLLFFLLNIIQKYKNHEQDYGLPAFL